MALPSQLAYVDFRGGLDTKSDGKLVVPGKLLKLENGIFTKGDAITKRNGYSALGNTTVGGVTLSSGERLGAYEDELLLFDKESIYSYSPQLDKWVDKGDVTPLTVTSRKVSDNTGQQTLQDMAQLGGVELIAWTDSSGGIRATVQDTTTGVSYQHNVAIDATGSRCKVLAIGKYLAVIFSDGANLKIRRLLPATPDTLESTQTLRTDLDSGNPFFDAVAHVTGGSVVVYNSSSSKVTVLYVTEDGLAGNPIIGLPGPVSLGEAADSCLTVVVNTGEDDDIYVCYHNTTNGVRCFALTLSFSTKFAVVTVDSTTTAMEAITGAFASSTSLRLFYQVTAGSTHLRFVRSNTVSNSGATGTSAVFARSVGLGHKAFVENSVVYVGLVHDSTLQASYFLANVSGTFVAKALHQVSGGLVAAPSLAQVFVDTGSTYKWAQLVKTKFISEVDEDNENVTYTQTGVAVGAYQFDAKDRFATAQMGLGLVCTGGVPQYYDGDAFVEMGFNLFPENGTFADSASGGSMSDGTYGYALVYEWVDRQGKVHRSAPQFTSVVVNGGGSSQSVTVTFPTLRITNKSNVALVVYRTEAAGSIHYRVTAASSPTANSKTVDTVAIVDTLADATIISAEILYTDGNILDNISPPAASVIAAAKNRIWLAGLEDDGLAWYSKPVVGNAAIAFSDFQTIRVDRASGQQVPGPITAIAAMDDKVVFFKRDSVLVIYGDGPNVAGRGGTWSEPQLVASDVGCTDQRSVVLTDRGLMFMSAKGIYILNRSLQVSYIGAEVEFFNTQKISSGVLLDDVDQVRYTYSDGNAVVWDTYYMQWSSFTKHTAVDAVRHRNVYHYLKSDGTVRKETPGKYRDEGAAYSLVMETAWLKFGGLQGFQRVRWVHLLGDFKSNHTLKVSFAYDYQEFFLETASWDTSVVIDASEWGDEATWGDATVWGGVEDNVYQLRAHLRRQKCEALKLRIEDEATDGQSFTINNLLLSVAIKKGGYKLRPAKTIGPS